MGLSTFIDALKFSFAKLLYCLPERLSLLLFLLIIFFFLAEGLVEVVVDGRVLVAVEGLVQVVVDAVVVVKVIITVELVLNIGVHS